MPYTPIFIIVRGNTKILKSLAFLISLTGSALPNAFAAPDVFKGEALLVLRNPQTSAAHEAPNSKSAAALSANEISSGVFHVRPLAPVGVGFEAPRTIAPFDRGDLEKTCRDMRAALGMREEDAWCEPNFVFAPAALPNDPHRSMMYSISQMQLSSAWDVSTGSEAVTVAVVDSGIDLGHPDLVENLWTNPGEVPENGIDDDANGYVDDIHGVDVTAPRAQPNDDIGHGTHVAGIIGGRGNNAEGGTGVNWKVRMMALKFIDKSGVGSSVGAVKAIDYAVRHGAKVINASWGSKGLHSFAIESAIRRARDAGILFVAAAGNNSSDNDLTQFYPASNDFSNVVSVGATDKTGALASFSNFGASSVMIAAPGDDITSSFPRSFAEYGGYASMSGTSMAAPQVAGVAALMLSLNPSLTPTDLKRLILESADSTHELEGKIRGAARLNAHSAVLAAMNEQVPPAHTDWRLVYQLKGNKGKAGRGFSLVAGGASKFNGETASLVLNLGGFACALSDFLVSDASVSLEGRIPTNYSGSVSIDIELDDAPVYSQNIKAFRAKSKQQSRKSEALSRRACKLIQASLR